MNKILALVYQQGGDFVSWNGFLLSEEDEKKIWKILEKYNNEGGSTCSNNYEEVIEDLK